MRILSLNVQNIKKIKALDITPNGDTVIIAGQNGAGKSSVIDSIAMVLGGAKLIPEKPVREGETKAEITVDLGKYVVKRHWTNPETSYLSVKNKEGAEFKGGQNILNDLIGQLSFDPLQFTTIAPDKRLAILKDITGVDFTALDAEYKKKYDERMSINRDGNQLKGRIETEFADLPAHPPTPQSVDDVKKNREAAKAHNLKITNARTTLTLNESRVNAEQKRMATIDQQIAALMRQAEESKAKIAEIEKENEACKPMAEQELANVDEFDALIEMNFKETAIIEKFAMREKVQLQLNDTRNKWTDLDNRIKQIQVEKEEMITNAKLPIRGLSFGTGDVLFNNLPFQQLSMAEQIKVSMAIAISMNPTLRLAMIYNGSLLDKSSMEQISAIAKAHDLQVWIERVADTPDGQSVFIENGEVRT